jgi:hypothetical protein
LLSMMTLKMLLVALIELQNDREMVYYVVVCLTLRRYCIL